MQIMTRNRYEELDENEPDDWDEDDYDPDEPETYPSGMYEDDELATVTCPYCRAEVLEDSERCPKCGDYISSEDAPRESKSGLWIIGMILALLVALIWAIGK